jgi:hypothetical protein
MDFAAILTAIGPQLIQLLSTVATTLHSPTPPAAPPSVPTTSGAMVHDAVIADLQAFLNAVPGLMTTPLAVDGWLGNLTKAAIEAGIAKLRAAGIG